MITHDPLQALPSATGVSRRADGSRPGMDLAPEPDPELGDLAGRPTPARPGFPSELHAPLASSAPIAGRDDDDEDDDEDDVFFDDLVEDEDDDFFEDDEDDDLYDDDEDDEEEDFFPLDDE